MADQTAPIDANSRQGLTAVSNADGTTIVRLWADPITHRLLTDNSGGGGGGTGTYYTVTGTIDGSNVTFTIPVAVTSDFILFLARQQQALTIDYTYSAGVSTTTITYAAAPDASLSGQPHQAFVIS